MSAPDIWEEIVACRRRGEAAALATIVSTQGSTPGKDPMKMLVRGDGTFVGSVGGGCLEAEVWEHAREVMRTLRPMTVSFSLTEPGGMLRLIRPPGVGTSIFAPSAASHGATGTSYTISRPSSR
jgi:xanthine/CO dehydrogenase XdhC/CoxF family maturation factor